jgi:hypothetical protein
MIECGVDLELFPMAVTLGVQHKFDYSKFWGNILKINEAIHLLQLSGLNEPGGGYLDSALQIDSGEAIASAQLKLGELQTRVRQKDYKKRVLNKVNLHLPAVSEGQLPLALNAYCHIIEAKIPTPIQLRAKDNVSLKSDTRFVHTASGTVLHPREDIETFVQFGDGLVPMSKQDVRRQKNIQLFLRK